jgi:hypothetical protein
MREIHQALFGYKDGHRLIQASTTLPPGTERQLTLLSDNSGVLPNEAFDGYLTGFPLKGHSIYVLSRTWAAPEMKRPGCVWTHSLLIPNEIIVELVSLQDLVKLHVRPTLDEIEQYRTSISSFSTTTGRMIGPRVAEVNQLRALMWEFYKVEELPVVFNSDSTDLAESLILEIWSQCWSRLRLSMSFCTATKGIRIIDGGPLVLQAFASSRAQMMPEQPFETKEWIETIIGSDLNQWHTFLAENATDMISNPAFIPLATEVFRCLNQSESSLNEVISTASTAMSQFGPKSNSDGLQFALFEKKWESMLVERKLLSLILDRDVAEVVEDRTRLINKFRAYVERDTGAGLSLIAESYDKQSVFSKDLLKTWVETMPDKAIPTTVKGKMLLDLVEVKPDLLYLATTWRSLRSDSMVAFQNVSNILIGNKDVSEKVAQALLTSGMYSEAAGILRSCSTSFFTTFLDQFAATTAKLVKSAIEEWIAVVCYANPLQVVKRVDQSAKLKNLLGSSLISTSLTHFVRDLDTLWNPSLDESELLDVILLISCFDRQNVKSYFIKSVLLIEKIHSALAKGKIPEIAMDLLDEYMPQVHPTDRWDTCERFRQYVLFSFRTALSSSNVDFPLELTESLKSALVQTYINLRQNNRIDSTLDVTLLNAQQQKSVSRRKKKVFKSKWF